jgi:hypothetical protein
MFGMVGGTVVRLALSFHKFNSFNIYGPAREREKITWLGYFNCFQMKKLFLSSCLFLSHCIVNGQSLGISYLTITSQSPAIVPVKNGGTGHNGTDNSFAINYEHFIKDKKISIVATYLKFNGCTLIYFEPGGWIGTDGNPIEAYGFCHGLKIHRVDIGLSYNLISKHKKFYFKPTLAAGLQLSRKTGWEFGALEPVNGPNYFELEPMWAEWKNTTQIVPSLGFRTGFVFWKRLDIGLGFKGVYAFKPYQKLYLKYQYKGVEQPTAEYETTGTGLFVTLGVGYRFAKLIK